MHDMRNQIAEIKKSLRRNSRSGLAECIGDLGNNRPVVIKLYSQDPSFFCIPLRVAEAIGKIPRVVDVLDGVENTISGPASLSDQSRHCRPLRVHA
jgi:hypothetical protein